MEMNNQQILLLANHRRVPLWVIKLVNDVVVLERNECAKVCLDLSKWHSKTVVAAFESAADAIQARGQK